MHNHHQALVPNFSSYAFSKGQPNMNKVNKPSLATHFSIKNDHPFFEPHKYLEQKKINPENITD